MASAAWLELQLRRADRLGLEVIVDLENVTFMDCAGLRPLLDANDDMGPARLSVTPGSPQVQRLFELAAVDELIRVVPRPVMLGRSAA